MIGGEDYDAILDRIEKAFDGEQLSDLDIKNYLSNKQTGVLSANQTRLADDLFSTYMKKKDVERELFEETQEREQKREETFIIVQQRRFSSHTSTGKTYQRSYSKWNNAQTDYLRQAKINKIPTKNIIAEYKKQFGESTHSESGIKTKLYRV